jgi:DNA modification methylase
MKTFTKQKTNAPKTPTTIGKYINRIICGDALKTLQKLPDDSVDCVVTSPPYWRLRDYEVKGQIGQESNIEDYLEKLINVFNEVRRVLKTSGTIWIILNDTYADKNKGRGQNKSKGNPGKSCAQKSNVLTLPTAWQIPAKSLCLIPERFAASMIESGWILRNQIIWHKPNQMPQSVTDRFTVDYEKLFFFVKNSRYYFDRQYEPLRNPERMQRRFLNPATLHKRCDSYWTLHDLEAAEIRRRRILEKGRNKRCVWTIATTKFSGDHFAAYPPRLIETPIRAGCPKNGIVLDPFIGSGTTAVVAKRLGRNFIGIELNNDYIRIAKKRVKQSGIPD